MTTAEFRLLGAVGALDDDGDLDLGPPQQRCVLALLLLEARRLVHIDRLIDLLWADDPPSGAKTTVRVYVSNLRKALAGTTVDLVTSGPGYILEVDPERVDVHNFRRLVAEAGSAGSDERAAALLEEALSLWHGDPLDDVAPEHLRQTICAALVEERLAAYEQWIDAELRSGGHAQVIPELVDLVRQNPLRERVSEQLMIALYRSGRRADALGHYQEVRDRLAEELGVDPSPDLNELHQSILRDDPNLTVQGSAASPALKPAQLPADLQTFTGREHELRTVVDLVPVDINERPSAVVITAIDGMAGVGKTTLAVHTAHRLAPHFPDGQLFIDLHGFTEGVRAVEPADALDRMLRTLGVPGDQIPQRLDDRAGLYRSILADRRMLILLDNAAGESQVQPLLPASPGSFALITSRRRLGGLDDVQPLSLDVLPPADAVTLFVRTAGEERLAGEPVELIADVVELCGRLPLAVRIAAARLRDRPTWTLEHLINRLRDKRYGLFELEVGERSVTAAVNLSYEQLTADEQRMFALLAVHPGPDFDAHAAAALSGIGVAIAERILDELLDVHLLQQDRPGHYRFHDLIRAHASHIHGSEIPEKEGEAALTRVLDFYSHTASLAMDVIYPHEKERRPHIEAPLATMSLGTPRAALAWLDEELQNVLAAAAHCAANGLSEYSMHFSATMHGHLHSAGYYSEAAELHGLALEAARRTGARGFELRALIGLAQVHRMQERHNEAADCFRTALELARAVGDRRGELDSLIGLGNVFSLTGRYEEASALLEPALEVAGESGDMAGEVEALIALAFTWFGQSRYDDAAEKYGRALEIAQRTGNRIGEVSAHLGSALVDRARGRLDAAFASLEEALRISRSALKDDEGRESGLGLFRQGELNALVGLGDVYRARGRYGAATEAYRSILQLARAIGNRNYQYEAHRGLGNTELAQDRPKRALDHFTIAFRFARDLGQLSDEVRANAGLGYSYEALGDVDGAREHFQAALDLLGVLGLPKVKGVEATDVRARLEALQNE